ncbi:MAG: hypothetical protein ACLQU1_35240 [Bryobacteraceae bacterium]
MKTTTLLLLVLSLAAIAADYPEAQISNGILQVKLLLPDAQNGYYRGTRFDWSGAISSLQFKGHEYFGKWFDRYDPKIHDAIQGPVEEFLTNGMGLGYEEVKTGESFVKIGVGAVRKPEERAFRQFNTYDITDNGKWTIRKGADYVEFTQELSDTNGYAYVYKKTIRLAEGKPQMVLEHSLKNTGKKPISTSVYEHNFYMLDHQPAGPDYSVRFPFEVHPQAALQGAAEARGKEFTYLKELPDRQSVYTAMDGFGDTPRDYDIRVENRKAGIGVRQTSDRPLAKLVFWSIRTTVCPEAYIDLKAEPGQEAKWRINYEFYTLPQ